MSNCTCGHISCVCDIQRRHKPHCAFRRSATCAVPIECEHGFDVCPTCDPCYCFIDDATMDYDRAMKGLL